MTDNYSPFVDETEATEDFFLDAEHSSDSWKSFESAALTDDADELFLDEDDDEDEIDGGLDTWEEGELADIFDNEKGGVCGKDNRVSATETLIDYDDDPLELEFLHEDHDQSSGFCMECGQPNVHRDGGVKELEQYGINEEAFDFEPEDHSEANRSHDDFYGDREDWAEDTESGDESDDEFYANREDLEESYDECEEEEMEYSDLTDAYADEHVNMYEYDNEGIPLSTDLSLNFVEEGDSYKGINVVIKHPYLPIQSKINPTTAKRRNRLLSKRLGWYKHRKKINEDTMRVLKWDSSSSGEAFAIGIAKWQIITGLPVTGILDRKSWIHLKPQFCLSYLPGEIRKSRTSAGFVGPDTRLYNRHLLIADFGVNRSRVKKRTLAEPKLKKWLSTFENDPSYKMIVRGFSDCIGERRNPSLRLARAKAVYKLLGPNARKRAKVEAAPKKLYITHNATKTSRALNRSVFIIFMRDLRFKPDVILGKLPKWGKIINNAKRALENHKKVGVELHTDQFKRIRCVLRKLSKRSTDDQIIPIGTWVGLDNDGELKRKLSSEEFKKKLTFRLRNHTLRHLHPNQPDEFIIRKLRDMDSQIISSIDKANNLGGGGQSGRSVSQGNKQIFNWIKVRQQNRNSVYSCFR